MAKKFLFFVGRTHHLQRLANILNELASRGAQVQAICSENAIGIDLSSSYLAKSGIPFKHMLDYYDPANTPKVTAMVANALSRMTSRNFESDLFSFIDPFWIAYSLREASECLLGFDKMLEAEKPGGVLVLHLNNFWCRIIAYLSKERNIPCYAFQEGLLRHRDQETQHKQSTAADYVSTLFVWSDASKQAYIEAGVEEAKILVTGMSHLDQFLKLTVDKPQFKVAFGFNPNQTLITLAMPQLSRFEGDPTQTIGQMAEWAPRHQVQLAIRFHPFEAPETAVQISSQLSRNPSVRVVTRGELPELILASDVVCSQHSTAAVETLALGVPLAEIDLQNQGVLESLGDAGVAINIRSGELDKLLKPMEGIIPQALVPWKAKNLGQLDGNGAKRIADRLLA